MSMLKVGITGGIGSGKSTVCRIFELLGIPVYYADDRAKWLMNHEPKIKSGIKALFGHEAYLPNGELNRKYISNIVFQQKNMLQELNQIVHPAVARDTEIWSGEQTNAKYIIKEAALLIESKSYLQLDRIILVVAPESVRIKRVIERDGTKAEEVKARMENQMTEIEKIPFADFIIRNDGNRALIPQILEIHQTLLAL